MRAGRSREMLLVAVLAIAQAAAPGIGAAQVDRVGADRAGVDRAGVDPDAVARGRELLAEAEFDRAIRAYDEALAGPLDRAQYLEALEGRATASWATGREDRARADLVSLAELDPTHRFPVEAPPDLTTLFESIVRQRAGPLALVARWSAGGALVVSIENDDAALARSIRAHLEGGEVIESEIDAGATTVELDPGAARSAWVELVGPSGVVLASAGDAARPLVRRTARGAADPIAPGADPSLLAPDEPGADDTGDRDLWIALGVGAGALVVIGVVVGVVVAVAAPGAADTAQPGAPVVVWP